MSGATQEHNYKYLDCAALSGTCAIPRQQQDSETMYFTGWALTNPHLFLHLIWNT